MVKCFKCNIDVEEDFEYCPHCGEKMQKNNEKVIQELKKDINSSVKKIWNTIKNVLIKIINIFRTFWGIMFILMMFLTKGTILYKIR